MFRPIHLTMLVIAGLAASSAGDARQWLAAPEGRECVKLGAIRAETAEADDSLILHAGGSSAYRSRLPKPCDGLRGLNSLARIDFSPANGDRLCKGDTFRLSGGDIVATVTGNDDASTRCTLGSFEPISEMSLTEALRR